MCAFFRKSEEVGGISSFTFFIGVGDRRVQMDFTRVEVRRGSAHDGSLYGKLWRETALKEKAEGELGGLRSHLKGGRWRIRYGCVSNNRIL